MTLLPVASTATAAVTAATGFALLVGHMLGDHPVQRDDDAAGKGRPTDDQLAAGVHPWTGWHHLARHCVSYVVTQAVALGVIALVAPLTLAGSVAALAVSGCTHAVIDRRWIVRAIIRAKGGCPNWREAPYAIDQSLHWGAIGVAAVTAALVPTALAAGVVLGLGAALVAAGLVAERLHAASIAAPSDRL